MDAAQPQISFNIYYKKKKKKKKISKPYFGFFRRFRCICTYTYLYIYLDGEHREQIYAE